MKSGTKGIGFIFGLVLISAFFVHWTAQFVAAEHTIYTWDYELLWTQSWHLAEAFRHSLWTGLAAFGWSLHQEYNETSGLLSAITMALFGPSRFCFVMSIVTLIVLPACLVGLLLFVRGNETDWSAVAFRLLAFFAILCVPVIWIVTLDGMTDVAGLFAVFVAVDLIVRTEPGSRDVRRWLAIGAALAIGALFKRWYLFWAVGTLAVISLETVITIVRSRHSRPISLASLRVALTPLFLVFCSLAAVFMLSFPRPFMVLKTDYSFVYSAYQRANGLPGAIVLNLKEIAHYYGIVAVLFSALCFALLVAMPATRRAAIYLFVPSWLALVDFSRVQSLSEQHLLLMFIAIVITPLFLAQHLLASAATGARVRAWALLLVALVINGLGLWSVFAPSPPFGNSVVQAAWPAIRKQPIQRHDLAQIESLLDFVASTTQTPDSPPPRDAYLLSSSYLLNYSTLTTYGFEMQKPMPGSDHICVTSDVDNRDGFPDGLLTARVVLVADPIQTHLTHEQRVLTIPAEEFLHGEAFAQAFQRQPTTYQLDDGVTVSAFVRTRPSTPEEIAALRAAVGVPSKPKSPIKAN